jgi:hypothetical protein
MSQCGSLVDGNAEGGYEGRCGFMGSLELELFSNGLESGQPVRQSATSHTHMERVHIEIEAKSDDKREYHILEAYGPSESMRGPKVVLEGDVVVFKEKGIMGEPPLLVHPLKVVS